MTEEKNLTRLEKYLLRKETKKAEKKIKQLQSLIKDETEYKKKVIEFIWSFNDQYDMYQSNNKPMTLEYLQQQSPKTLDDIFQQLINQIYKDIDTGGK